MWILVNSCIESFVLDLRGLHILCSSRLVFLPLYQKTYDSLELHPGLDSTSIPRYVMRHLRITGGLLTTSRECPPNLSCRHHFPRTRNSHCHTYVWSLSCSTDDQRSSKPKYQTRNVHRRPPTLIHPPRPPRNLPRPDSSLPQL